MDGRSPHQNTETVVAVDPETSHAQSRNFGHIALKSTDDQHSEQTEAPNIPTDTTTESNTSESSPNTEELAKSFLRRHGQQLNLFARDSSLSFVPSKTGETFSFDAKAFRVNVPLSWFASEQYTEDELDFANHHELAHFIDMRKNPEAYLENFEQIREDVVVLAKDYLQKHPGKTSLDKAIGFFYRELHNLYNVLDDIYVNNVVFSRNHHFDYGDGRASVESLYEKLGFGEADQTDQPLHRQMIFSLLRDEMLGDTHDKTVVDERVESKLSKKKLGKSIREWVNFDLKPTKGILVDPAERYRIIRSLIQPEYISLLEISLDEQEEKNQKGQTQENQAEEDSSNSQESDNTEQPSNNSQEGSDKGKQDGNNSSNSDFDPFGDDSSKPKDILDHGEDAEKTIKDILESFKESDEVAKMSPEERAKYQRQKKIEEFDDAHGISAEERRENERIKNKIASARKEMRKFWQRLIGKSIEYRSVVIPRQRKGRLNINSYIDQYPEVVSAERKGNLRTLEIYDRQGLERRVVDQPETIDITLLVDCSGSMGEESKVDSAKSTAALLMYSAKDFNEELDATRRRTHSRLHVNTEVIVYGSDYETVKYFEKDHTRGVNDAEIIKSVSKIDSQHGGTDDALPLADIQSRLTVDEKTRLKSGKLKKIIFEITDGASTTPEESAVYLKSLSDEGVLVVGFQIGTVSNYERDTFEQIWNGDSTTKSPNKKGIYIGEDVSKLPSALMSALSELLNDIII